MDREVAVVWTDGGARLPAAVPPAFRDPCRHGEQLIPVLLGEPLPRHPPRSGRRRDGAHPPGHEPTRVPPGQTTCARSNRRTRDDSVLWRRGSTDSSRWRTRVVSNGLSCARFPVGRRTARVIETTPARVDDKVRTRVRYSRQEEVVELGIAERGEPSRAGEPAVLRVGDAAQHDDEVRPDPRAAGAAADRGTAPRAGRRCRTSPARHPWRRRTPPRRGSTTTARRCSAAHRSRP